MYLMKIGHYSDVKLRDVAAGVDVGIKSFAVISISGQKRIFKNINRTHKVRRLVRQLKHRQRALSRKQKGSHNRAKELTRVRELYGRIKRIRRDYATQTAAKIIKMRSAVIVLETLTIQHMMKNKYIARAVADTSEKNCVLRIDNRQRF